MEAKTMFHYNRVHFIFFVSVNFFRVLFSLEVSTEKTVTVVKGRNISLPCKYSGDTMPDGVYWYKHASIGAHSKEIVARYYGGKKNPVPDYERFELTENYNLMIYNVSIADETTYSYVVLNGATQEGKMDVRVTVLGELIIEKCEVTKTGRCTYKVPKDSLEQVEIVCKLCNVRPHSNLTLTRSNGTVLETAGPEIYEEDGLSNISSKLLISKPHSGDECVCIAKGEAVNGTSSMTVTFHVEDGKTELKVLLPVIAACLSLLSTLLIVAYYKRYRLPGRQSQAMATKSSKVSQDNDVESQPFTEKQVERGGDTLHLKAKQLKI